MPTHVYQPPRQPATWWDRLLVHPLDTTAAVIMLFMGIASAVALATGTYTPSASLEELPGAVMALVAGFLLAGSLLILLGLNWSGDEVSHGWAIERFGWLLGAGGLLTYSASVLAEFPQSTFAWGVHLLLGAGGLLRFWSILKIETMTRRTIAAVREGAM